MPVGSGTRERSRVVGVRPAGSGTGRVVALTGDRARRSRAQWPGSTRLDREVVPWACATRVAASREATSGRALVAPDGGRVELVALDDRQGDRQLNRGYTTWDSNLLGGRHSVPTVASSRSPKGGSGGGRAGASAASHRRRRRTGRRTTTRSPTTRRDRSRRRRKRALRAPPRSCRTRRGPARPSGREQRIRSDRGRRPPSSGALA